MSSKKPDSMLAMKYYRIRCNVLQMLRDRGYMVADYELSLTKQQFKEKYGNVPKAIDLVMLKAKLTNPEEKILVFFHDEPKVGVKSIGIAVNHMKAEQVSRAILIVERPLNSFAAQCVAEVAPKYLLDVFLETELLINVKEHILVPEHEVLTEEEKRRLLERYTLTEKQVMN